MQFFPVYAPDVSVLSLWATARSPSWTAPPPTPVGCATKPRSCLPGLELYHPCATSPGSASPQLCAVCCAASQPCTLEELIQECDLPRDDEEFAIGLMRGLVQVRWTAVAGFASDPSATYCIHLHD